MMIGNYDNSPLSSINDAMRDYHNIIYAFNHVRNHHVAFATNNSESKDDDNVCVKHLTQSITNYRKIKSFDFKLKWTSDEIDDFTRQISDKVICKDNKYNYDSLIWFVTSHGNNNVEIYDSNGEEYVLEFLYNKFNNKECRCLRQKPKIFFLDTIKHTTTTKLVTVASKTASKITCNENDEKETKHNDLNHAQGSTNSKHLFQVYQKESHFRKVFGNSSENQSLQIGTPHEKGSIFVQSICQTVCNDAKFLNCNFDDFLFDTRQNMTQGLGLPDNAVHSVSFHDYNTMPYDIQFISCTNTNESKINELENEMIIQHTVCIREHILGCEG